MKHQLSHLQVALVYDHLTTQFGGAELVLRIIGSLFPTAPLFTTVFDQEKVKWIKADRVKCSFLQNTGFLKNYHQLLAPLHPLAVEQLDVSQYQLIISVTSGTAKGILTQPHQLHVSYILTPPRYLDSTDEEHQQYIQSHALFKFPGMSRLAQPFFTYLSIWDGIAGWRPDKMIAISQLVASRIKHRYQRDADAIIYPPFIPKELVTDAPLRDGQLPEFLLSLSRLVSYKRIDISIKSALKLKKLLVVAGQGVASNDLRQLAAEQHYLRLEDENIVTAINKANSRGKYIVFLGSISNSEKAFLLQHAAALLMPGQEDFGLTGLEAAYYGTPTITNAASGIAEILTEHGLALHLKEKSVAALCTLIKKLPAASLDAQQLQHTARQYTETHFSQLFLKTLYQFWKQHSTISPEDSKK